LLYQAYLKILSLGYRYFVGNVVNEMIKPVVRRAHLIMPEIQIRLDEMEI